MNIPETAERKPLTIYGLTFSVPVVVTAENICESLTDVCEPSMAAQILQQTFMENWRNNFAKSVADTIKKLATENGIEFSKVSILSDEDAQTINDAIDIDQLQVGLDAYIQTYVPGIRRTGGGEALSPVDRESRKLAVEIVRGYLESELGIGRTARSETYKTWDAKIQEELNMTGAEHIEEMAQNLIEANPTIRETAESNIKARENLASGIELSFAG